MAGSCAKDTTIMTTHAPGGTAGGGTSAIPAPPPKVASARRESERRTLRCVRLEKRGVVGVRSHDVLSIRRTATPGRLGSRGV